MERLFLQKVQGTQSGLPHFPPLQPAERTALSEQARDLAATLSADCFDESCAVEEKYTF